MASVQNTDICSVHPVCTTCVKAFKETNCYYLYFHNVCPGKQCIGCSRIITVPCEHRTCSLCGSKDVNCFIYDPECVIVDNT